MGGNTMSKFINDKPDLPWNDINQTDDPLRPWNNVSYAHDPFAPWNNPTATQEDYENYCRQNHIRK